MKIAKKLDMLYNLSKNIANYCAYFYILEYLVRFKGYYDLEDELKWIAELLRDEIFLYGTYSVAGELLNIKDGFTVRVVKPIHKIGEQHMEFEYCCHTIVDINEIGQYAEEFMPIRIRNLFYRAASFEAGCCDRAQFKYLLYSLIELLTKYSIYWEPSFEPTTQSIFTYFWIFSHIHSKYITEPLMRSTKSNELTPSAKRMLDWFNVEDKDYILTFFGKIRDREKRNKFIDMATSMLTYCFLEEDGEVENTTFFDASKRIFEIEENPRAGKGGWCCFFGGKRWATIAATLRDLPIAADIVHKIDIMFHLQHNCRIWLDKILTEEETNRLKEILDAKFNGDLKALYPYAAVIDPNIRTYATMLTNVEVSKTGWRAKEEVLKQEVQTALEFGSMAV